VGAVTSGSTLSKMTTVVATPSQLAPPRSRCERPPPSLCRLRTRISTVSWAFSGSGCPVVLADEAAEDRPASDR
jgi:hypothetical protein